MTSQGHATRTAVRKARGLSVDYSAKNAARRTGDGRVRRRWIVKERRAWRGPNIPPPTRIRGER